MTLVRQRSGSENSSSDDMMAFFCPRLSAWQKRMWRDDSVLFFRTTIRHGYLYDGPLPVPLTCFAELDNMRALSTRQLVKP